MQIVNYNMTEWDISGIASAVTAAIIEKLPDTNTLITALVVNTIYDCSTFIVDKTCSTLHNVSFVDLRSAKEMSVHEIRNELREMTPAFPQTMKLDINQALDLLAMGVFEEEIELSEHLTLIKKEGAEQGRSFLETLLIRLVIGKELPDDHPVVTKFSHAIKESFNESYKLNRQKFSESLLDSLSIVGAPFRLISRKVDVYMKSMNDTVEALCHFHYGYY